MRELDLLLGEFLERHWDELADPERDAFERLLGHDDQEVIDWTLGRAAPPDPGVAALMRRVRGEESP